LYDSLRLGRVGGVRIGVNWSLFALVGLVAYSLATSGLPGDVAGYSSAAYWLAGVLAAVALFIGVLVHEIAHAIAARRAKLPVDGITLWFMGGLTRIEDDSGNPLTELVIALVGPLASAAVGGVCLGFAVLTQSAGWSLAAGALRWLGFINILLGAFNLVPASPLDGGRVLHGFLWWATRNRWLATRLTAGAGTLMGAACVMAGFLALEQKDLQKYLLDWMALLMMGWFVLSSAKKEQVSGRAQHVLGEVRVSDIMRPAVIAPGWLTANAFWNEWAAPHPEAAFLLERWGGGGWSGALTAQRLAAVPPGMQWSVRAQDIALPLPAMPGPDGQAPLAPNQPAMAIAGRSGAALPVEDHGRVVGVVLAPDVAALVAKGAPVPRRTWVTQWAGMAPPGPSGYAWGKAR
jgi:Zn-dependent protease